MRTRKVSAVVMVCLLAMNLSLWTPELVAGALVAPRGTIVKLVLKNSLDTIHNKAGDPFTAEVAEDVMAAGQVAIEKGATVSGEITKLETPKRLAGLKGQASMTLRFDRIHTVAGEEPLVASLVSVHDAIGSNQPAKVKEEGEVEAQSDKKGMVTKGAIGVAAGTVLGAIFGNVSRGLLLGSLGGAVAILAPKGKDISMPQGAGLLIRLDRDLAIPSQPTS